MAFKRPGRGRKRPDPEDRRAAMEAALRLLGIRSRTEQELGRALERRGFTRNLVGTVLLRLTELGYLDDARFAVSRAAALLRGGKLGERGVEAKLLGHGLGSDEARRALGEAMSEVLPDFEGAARHLLERRGRGLGATPQDRARDFRFLIARGFSAQTARRALGPKAVADDLEAGEDSAFLAPDE